MDGGNADELYAALRKKALGFTAGETTTEYDAVGAVVRRKVSVKDVPPDLTALKMLLESREEHEPDEEELMAERERVLRLLGEYYAKSGGNDGDR